MADYEGKGVYYFVKDKMSFAGKNILIVGGGDSAVDWALNMNDCAKKITLIHRRDVFRAHEQSVWTDEVPVDVRLFYEVKQVIGDGNSIKQVVIFDNRTKAETTLDVDAILVNIGFRADLGPIKDWGLQIEGREIATNGKMETSIARSLCRRRHSGPRRWREAQPDSHGLCPGSTGSQRGKGIRGSEFQDIPGHSSEMKSVTTPTQ